MQKKKKRKKKKISSKCVSVQKEMAPTAVFLSGQSHAQRSLAGYSPTAGHFWREETVPGKLRRSPEALKLSMAQPELWLNTPSSQASCSWPLSPDTGVGNQSLNHGWGLPWWLSIKESSCQCRRRRLDPCPCCGAAEPTQRNHWACAPDAGSCNCWAHEPQSLWPTTTGATSEKPTHHN